jgi:hypothetical protein
LIHIIILAVDCIFFAILEVMYPRDGIHYVEDTWEEDEEEEGVRDQVFHYLGNLAILRIDEVS